MSLARHGLPGQSDNDIQKHESESSGSRLVVLLRKMVRLQAANAR